MNARRTRGYRLLGVLAVLASFALAACPQPQPPAGALACSPKGECPRGYRCQDGACYGEKADLANNGADLASHDHGPAADLAGADLANRTNQCEMYCTCMMANCPTNLRPEFDSPLACASYCSALPAGADMDCRILHCALALSESDSVTHCPHARGIGSCADK